MSETLSIRIDAKTKRRLDALARRSRQTKSFLAAEAISAYLEAEEWQFGEVQEGIRQLDAGEGVPHDKVARRLRSWGKKTELKPPR